MGAPSSCQVGKGEMTCDGKTTSRKESGPVLRNQGNGNYWPLICKRLRTKGIQRACDDETHEFSGSQPTAGSSALAKPLKSTAENPRRPHDFRILVDTFFLNIQKKCKITKRHIIFLETICISKLGWIGKIMLNCQVLDPWRNIPEPERLRPPNEGRACFQSIAADSTTVLAQVLTTCATSINFPL